jgi:SOS-response transcriptional repressor LexA
MRFNFRTCQGSIFRSEAEADAYKNPRMAADIRDRIRQRLDELKKSPRKASLDAGLSADAIRGIFRNPDSSPSVGTIEKLAAALETTADWLAFGDEKQVFDVVALEATPSDGQIISIPIVGIAEAGAFREVIEYNDVEPEYLFAERDPDFPRARMFAMKIAGDSMNDAEPPILPGSRVICVDFDETGLPLAEGMLVVIERSRDEGQMLEWSIKEVEIHEDRVEYCPRSTNKGHRPIVVPYNADPEDTRMIRVMGLVRSINYAVPTSRSKRR